MRTMTKTASCLVLAAAMTAPAYAELDDSPYFNLWSGTAGNQQVGQGDYVLLCGTSGGCNGDTVADANGIGTGYAIFKTAAPNSGAGSGHIDPFLRFQHNEGAALGNATTEAAFNTSASPDIGTIYNSDLTVYSANQAKDVDAGKDFNHAIRLGDLIVDEDGYFTFRLDINEPGGTKSNILLDELQIFVAASATLNQYVLDKAVNQPDGDPVSGSLTGATKKIWDMDYNKFANGIGKSGTTVGASPNLRLGGITLDSVKSSGPSNGSGDFDMEFLLHSSLFSGPGITDDSYVYLYNFMGQADSPGPNNAGEAGAGFEEWAATLKTAPDTPPPGGGGVPEPGTAFLMAAGIVGLFRAQRSKSAKTG